MRIISKNAFKEATKEYPTDAVAIMDLHDRLKATNFDTPEELMSAVTGVDNFKHKGHWYVIDIAGNNLRLIAYISFVKHKLYVKYIVSHAEYDKINAKAYRGKI